MRLKNRVAVLAAAALALPLAGMAIAPPATAAVYQLSNTNSITITDNTTSPAASIIQYGLSTVITDVNVRLNNMSHTFSEALDIEVVGPDGTAVALMSDSCGGNTITASNFTFDDQAAGFLPDSTTCATGGTFKPTNNTGSDTWAVTPTGTTLAAFNGKQPNAVAGSSWRIYVRDQDGFGDSGQVAGGWTITITTATVAPVVVPAFGSAGSGVAAPYGVPVSVSGKTGLITDVNVTIPGLSHTWPADLQIVVKSPTGKTAALMNNNCSNVGILEKSFTFDDQAATVIGAGSCTAGGTFKVTGNAPSSLPGPAPAAPYGASLAALNGDSPNGTWQFYVNDTTNTDGGWMGTPTLTIKTTDAVAPDTLIVGKKPENTSKRSVKIKFKSTEAGSTFKCKVDAKPYKTCSSPLKLKNLKLGKHKVFVVATDAAGNKDPKALKVKWKIFEAKVSSGV